MDAPPVTCPLCESNNIRKTGHPDDSGLDVYICGRCGGQFTMQVPDPRSTSAGAERQH
jgi:transposase-like protein